MQYTVYNSTTTSRAALQINYSRSSRPAQLAFPASLTGIPPLQDWLQWPHCCSNWDSRFACRIVLAFALTPAGGIVACCPCLAALFPPFTVVPSVMHFHTLLILGVITMLDCGANQLPSLCPIPLANGCRVRIVIRSVTIRTSTICIVGACRSGRCS